MDILLDNIIYSLQKSGGASVVWTEHIKRLLKDNRYYVRYIEYDNSSNNIFRSQLKIPKDLIFERSSKYLNIKRYFDVGKNGNNPYIFHSSHYRIARGKNVKNVTTVHDFVYERYVTGIRQKVHSIQKWHSIRKSDAIICISESTKKDLLYYLPDVDENKIYVIHNGVNDSFRKIDSCDYNLKLPFENGEYALYIGCRHVPYKNFTTAVQICKYMNLPLITVGGEPISDGEKNNIDNILGADHFLCLHGTSTNDLNELYNRAFILLYPSLYEGFGIPVIEAQKCGCPVLCMSSSSIPEIVGKSDLCVNNTLSVEAICEIVKSLFKTDFREREIQQGFKNCQRFSWDKTYEKTVGCYNKLIERL